MVGALAGSAHDGRGPSLGSFVAAPAGAVRAVRGPVNRRLTRPDAAVAGRTGRPDARRSWLLVLPWELSAPGGVNQVVENLLRSAPRVLGVDALLLVNVWGHRRPQIERSGERTTVRMTLPAPAGPGNELRVAAGFLLRLPAMLLRLRRLLVEQGIDQVNVHYPGLSAFVWLLACRLTPWRTRLVLSFHGSDLQQARRMTGGCAVLWRLLVRRADEIVLCSEQLQRRFVETFPCSGPTRVIVNGVDPEAVLRQAAAGNAVGLPSRFVLALATIERKKGLDVLVDAFAAVAQRHPDLSLVLAGRVAEPDFLAALNERCAGLPCAARITVLTGLVHADAMAALAKAALMVLPSREEPFGIVVLEAGVLGVPVIATQACGVAQLLVDGQEFIAVPTDDVAALAAAIDRVVAGRVAVPSMARALAERVRRDFTWDQIVLNYRAPGAGPR